MRKPNLSKREKEWHQGGTVYECEFITSWEPGAKRKERS